MEEDCCKLTQFKRHNWYLNLDHFSLYNLVFMYYQLHPKRLSKSQHGIKINFMEKQPKMGTWPAVHPSHTTNSNGDHLLRTFQTPIRRGHWLHRHQPLLITFVVIQTFFLFDLWTRATYDADFIFFYNLYGEHFFFINTYLDLNNGNRLDRERKVVLQQKCERLPDFDTGTW